MPSQTTHQPAADTYLYAPAELDWFRHASASESRPMFKVIFEVEPDDPSEPRPWWRSILDELS